MSTALITGASQGLGKALMLTLARAGVRVVGVARNGAPLEAVVETVRQGGGHAWGLVADVGLPSAAHRIAGEAHALVGPIDLLIHNASTLGPTPLKLLGDTTPEDFDHVLQVNLAGPFRLTRAIVGSMVLRGSGTVVFVSSDASVEAYPRWGAYGASKAGLDHLARIWAAELEGTGVHVLAIDPGEMDTAMHAAAIPDADPATLQRPDDVAQRILALVNAPNETVRVRAAS